MKKPSGGPIRARDSEINYYAASGMLFLLGLVVSIFMTVLCFRAQRPGSSQMLLLLDGLQAVLIFYLAFLYGRQRRILRKKLGYSRPPPTGAPTAARCWSSPSPASATAWMCPGRRSWTAAAWSTSGTTPTTPATSSSA